MYIQKKLNCVLVSFHKLKIGMFSVQFNIGKD